MIHTSEKQSRVARRWSGCIGVKELVVERRFLGRIFIVRTHSPKITRLGE
jgi:hypothetical protein